jgi:hypothetical protein
VLGPRVTLASIGGILGDFWPILGPERLLTSVGDPKVTYQLGGPQDKLWPMLGVQGDFGPVLGFG